MYLLQSQTKVVGTLRPNAVFFPLVLPLSLSKRLSHQTLYTNIEGTRRHKSVPTILTETVDKLLLKLTYPMDKKPDKSSSNRRARSGPGK